MRKRKSYFILRQAKEKRHKFPDKYINNHTLTHLRDKSGKVKVNAPLITKCQRIIWLNVGSHLPVARQVTYSSSRHSNTMNDSFTHCQNQGIILIILSLSCVFTINYYLFML